MLKSKLFKSKERLLFLVITLVQTVPIFQGNFFPTMDGPAHLYNSTILNEIIFQSNENFNSYISLNKLITPNWIGHFILMIGKLFFPAYIAEKVLLLFYLIGLPYSFRYLVKTLNPKRLEFSYLIFPFGYSFLFTLGFYNFSIAIIGMFMCLGFWIRNIEFKTNHKQTSIFLTLLLLIFFSHASIFAITLFAIAMHILYKSLIEITKHPNDFISVIRRSLAPIFKILIAAVIPLILFFNYYYSTSAQNRVFEYKNQEELKHGLLHLDSIISYNSFIEEAFTTKIVYILALLTATILFIRLRNLSSHNYTTNY